jgi:tRNA A-37 threonylcarbamoyl transferase component Bud32
VPTEAANSSSLFSIAVGCRKFVRIHPDYQELCAGNLLESPSAFLSIEGEIISGHPDRHVMRVHVGGMQAILKREHRVPWKDRFMNWRHGFGWVSISVREAALLEQLRRFGIGVPEWIAVGESADGQAFLLLRSIGPAEDLRHYLYCRRGLSQRDRRSLARRLAYAVARIHNLGFKFPDLYAKHIWINSAGSNFTFLDWQRGRRSRRVTWRDRCRDLAALNASLSDELAAAPDRFIFLLAYFRAANGYSRSFKSVCRRIQRRSEQLAGRSSVREQRLPTFHKSQTISWLDGEAICVTPLGRSFFDRESLEHLAYSQSALGFERTRILLPNDRPAILIRRATARTFGRAVDWLRRKPWLSPETTAAADLLRRERLGEPPRLLAFGQRARNRCEFDSFLLKLAGDDS